MKRHFRHHLRGTATQRGAALLVALILLVVITLVGLAAIGTTILQNKAASNQYDRQIAFQGAEAALRQAQITITTTATAAAPVPDGIEDCSTAPGGSEPVTACHANPFADAAAATFITPVPASAYSVGPVAAMQPQYVVQYMGTFVAPEPKIRQIGGQTKYGAGQSQQSFADYYRISARSGDPAQVTGRAVVTLQSTFRN
ncbi:MAG: pilus assembly PilX family protein [Rhodanobacteraceae bacterium]